MDEEIKVIPKNFTSKQKMKFIPASDSASAGAFGASGAPGIKNGHPKFIQSLAELREYLRNDMEDAPL